MSKTPQKRYTDSIAYLTKVNHQLGHEVHQKLGPLSATVGAEISLSGTGYWNALAGDKHDAARALLLCFIAYFRTPHCRMDWASTQALTDLKKHFSGKSRSEIEAEILYFAQKPGVNASELATAAENNNSATGVPDYLNRTRNDKELGGNPVCYNGVFLWLFVAGFVSKRWLAKDANELDANTANDKLGDGAVLRADQLDSIPRGYIWNIHRVNDKTTCHWGVSLGNDRAAACNNTDQSPAKTLVYEKGDTKFGIFKFTDICDVLNGTVKYGYDPSAPTANNLVVRAFDPATITTYY